MNKKRPPASYKTSGLQVSDLVPVRFARSCSRSALSYMGARKESPCNQCWTGAALYIHGMTWQVGALSGLASFPGCNPDFCAYYIMEKNVCKYTCGLIHVTVLFQNPSCRASVFRRRTSIRGGVFGSLLPEQHVSLKSAIAAA